MFCCLSLHSIASRNFLSCRCYSLSVLPLFSRLSSLFIALQGRYKARKEGREEGKASSLCFEPRCSVSSCFLSHGAVSAASSQHFTFTSISMLLFFVRFLLSVLILSFSRIFSFPVLCFLSNTFGSPFFLLSFSFRFLHFSLFHFLSLPSVTSVVIKLPLRLSGTLFTASCAAGRCCVSLRPPCWRLFVCLFVHFFTVMDEAGLSRLG